jgi:outer membrane protein assembly factor BamB
LLVNPALDCHTAAMKPTPVGLGLVGLTLCSLIAASAQEWTRFRGPNGTGLSRAKHLPVKWSDGEYLWRAALPGTGHSSPVLWGERVFVTSADPAAGHFTVSCWNATDGSALWQKQFPLPSYHLHANNNYAAASPAADARRVYVARVEGGDLLLTALTHEGAVAWEYKAGPFKTEHGLGHSPVVFGNRILLVDDQDLAGRVLALDADTGHPLWESPRRPGRADYSTPCLFPSETDPAWVIVESHEDGISGLNINNGTVAWTDENVLDKRSVSSPIVAAGLIIGTCGSGGGGNYVAALRPPDQRSKAPVLAYQIRRAAPYVPTPIAVGDLLFLWSDSGIVTCAQADKGTTYWQERVGGNFFSSPICVDGKLYGTSTAGEVVVLEASRQFKELGRSSLGEPSHATPAVANGRIYFRTLGHLLAIGPKAP